MRVGGLCISIGNDFSRRFPLGIFTSLPYYWSPGLAISSNNCSSRISASTRFLFILLDCITGNVFKSWMRRKAFVEMIYYSNKKNVKQVMSSRVKNKHCHFLCAVASFRCTDGCSTSLHLLFVSIVLITVCFPINMCFWKVKHSYKSNVLHCFLSYTQIGFLSLHYTITKM